jgi:hypothetical protein
MSAVLKSRRVDTSFFLTLQAAVDKERSELTARRTALELEVKEIQEGVATDGEAQSTLAAGDILLSNALILHF